MPHERIVSVIGLGYVGLPVAVAFGEISRTVGFDINTRRIYELRDGYDRTGEVTADELSSARILFSNDINHLCLAVFHAGWLLGYQPAHTISLGLKEALGWNESNVWK